MDFLKNLQNKVSGLFSPQPSQQQVSQPSQTQGSLQGPGYKDPYIQNMATQNGLNNLDRQLYPMAEPSRMILAYTANHQPQYGPPAPGYAQPAPVPQNAGYEMPQSQPQAQYTPPPPQHDPQQTMALFSMLRTLMQNGIPQGVMPTESISTTPYTNAANQIAQSRQQMESSILPQGGSGGGSMLM